MESDQAWISRYVLPQAPGSRRVLCSYEAQQWVMVLTQCALNMQHADSIVFT